MVYISNITTTYTYRKCLWWNSLVAEEEDYETKNEIHRTRSLSLSGELHIIFDEKLSFGFKNLLIYKQNKNVIETTHLYTICYLTKSYV